MADIAHTNVNTEVQTITVDNETHNIVYAMVRKTNIYTYN